MKINSLDCIEFISERICPKNKDYEPVSRSLLWKGPPLVKEGQCFSFEKVTLKFSFKKTPLTLLTKGIPCKLRREQMLLDIH